MAGTNTPSVFVGDTVFYQSYGTRDGRHPPAQLPLMVVQVHDDGAVSGWVFYRDGLRYHPNVPHSWTVPQPPATWTLIGAQPPAPPERP